MCKYILYIIYFLLFEISFIYIMGFFVTITINDASVGIVDDEGNFQFSPKATFTSTFYIHITLAADTKRRILRFAQLRQC